MGKSVCGDATEKNFSDSSWSKPALHVPADEPTQLALFDAHVAHAVLSAAVLYVPAVHATHVTPPSVLPKKLFNEKHSICIKSQVKP